MLPIKMSHRRKGMGLVHGRSKTGETVFVEPAEVLELQNQLDDTELELEQSIARILRALTQRLGEEAERVREALEVAAEVDAAVRVVETRDDGLQGGSAGIVALPVGPRERGGAD